VAEIGSTSTRPQWPVSRTVNSGMLKPTHDSKQSPKRNKKQHEQDEEQVSQDRKKSSKNKSQNIMNTHFDGYA